MDPVAKTLQTTELLEQILIHVPFLDILQCQRVARHWHDCVKGSVLLQGRLFFAPIPQSEASAPRTSDSTTVQPVEANPLLQDVFQIRHWEGLQSRVDVVPSRRHRYLNQLVYLEDVSPGARIATYSGKYSALVPKYDVRTPKPLRPHFPCSRACMMDPTSCPQTNTLPTASIDSYSMESWGSMLACQPPLPTLTLRCTQVEGRRGIARVKAANGTGVTLGDIVVAAGELYRLAPQKRGFCFNAEMTIHQEVKCRKRFDAKKIEELFAADELFLENGRPRIRLELPWITMLKCNLA